MPLCIFTLENNKYYIKQYQQDLIDSITNMVEKLNNPELFLTTLKPTVQNISWIIENPIISYKIIATEKLEDTTVQLMKQFGMQSTRSDLCPDAYINFEESEYLRGRINEEDKPVMDRIAILDGQIEVFKDCLSKLDSEEKIINKYSNYNNYIISTYHCVNPPTTFNFLTKDEYNAIRNCNFELNLYTENYFDGYLKNVERIPGRVYCENSHKKMKVIKNKFLNSYQMTEEIIKAKSAKIKYDKLINKYGDKKSIEESLQDLLTKKLKLIDSDEYKSIDDV